MEAIENILQFIYYRSKKESEVLKQFSFLKNMLEIIKIILISILLVFSFNSYSLLALDCKDLKGLSLRNEKFSKDSFSKARLLITFFSNNNSMFYNWNQNTGTFVDMWNSIKGFEELKVVQSNSNMALGYSVKNGLEGIRIHFKKKTAVYAKHVAPLIDGFGTDGIYKMKCIDVTQELQQVTKSSNKEN